MKTKHTSFAILNRALASSSDNLLHILPAGSFRADHDDRPLDVAAWYIDETIADHIISTLESQRTDIVIDYEHQTLLREKNGKPAPAAGWITAFIWQEKGLFAQVRWTDKARAMIASSEYRYISPVFTYNKKTGHIENFLHAALTNTPALDVLGEVSAALSKQTGDIKMDLTSFIKILGLPEGASLADCMDAIAKKQQLLDEQASLLYALRRVLDLKETASLSEMQTALSAHIQPGETIAALNSARTSQSKVISDLQTQIAALNTELDAQKSAKSESEIDDAIADGRLLPSQKEWAVSLSKESPEALKQFLAVTRPITALTQQQTAGIAVTQNIVALSAEESQVADALGLTHDAYRSIKEQEQKA